MEFKHKPVLLDECIEGLNINPNGIYVDGTLGGGGHSFHIIEKLSENGKLIGIDRDKEAIAASELKLKDFHNKIIYHGNHDDIKRILEELDIDKVDGILLDLGISSYQIDEAERGFSYMLNSKLDMRMNREDKLSAYEVVNKYSEDNLSNIFSDFGEERYSKRIAAKICEVRKIKSIETTHELVSIVRSCIPYKATLEKQHPAKRVFQAIRIEVNSELDKLKEAVIDSVNCLNKSGRLAVITFHSLEDRIVKHAFEELEGKCKCPSDFPVCICKYKSYGKNITKKPIISNELELKENSRARSAKLRIFEKN
ncbi:MAG: 16S rRNA (cytosine(1402)-N(4))-methyltransferase RsmH [Clostridia bacterium]|nr:16S rRNA (cytosine(1402)-N(4))-methyltransferase RsmH [Clostridia bacterium]MDD4386903.1 16S rRNA (cytosine(1402)-N(4))-methyltransferase RsmH [Clostridia bacterium]